MKKENKKVNNLEVFKKVIATLLATVTIGTMSGCEGKKVPVDPEPTPTPGITTPVDPEPTPVEVDPNAPLFDIQDEEVFNQKVDELYAEIEGVTLIYEGSDVGSIETREQAELLFSMWNINSISDEQKEKLLPKNIDAEQAVYAYDNALVCLNMGMISSNKCFQFDKYIANSEDKKIFTEFDKLSNNYNETKSISDEDIKIMKNILTNYKLSAESNDATFVIWYDGLVLINGICVNYKERNGNYPEIFDELMTTNNALGGNDLRYQIVYDVIKGEQKNRN